MTETQGKLPMRTRPSSKCWDTISEMGSPTMKDMGAVMKNAKAKFGDARVDGRLLSEAVKKELAGK